VGDADAALRQLKRVLLRRGFRIKGVHTSGSDGLFTTTVPTSSVEDSSSSSSSCGASRDLFAACELEFCNYGHIADQNIHLNILAGINVLQSPSQSPSQSQGRASPYEDPSRAEAFAVDADAAIASPSRGGSSSSSSGSMRGMRSLDPESGRLVSSALLAEDFVLFAATTSRVLNDEIFAIIMRLNGMS
jgi:hypothetical protein